MNAQIPPKCDGCSSYMTIHTDPESMKMQWVCPGAPFCEGPGTSYRPQDVEEVRQQVLNQKELIEKIRKENPQQSSNAAGSARSPGYQGGQESQAFSSDELKLLAKRLGKLTQESEDDPKTKEERLYQNLVKDVVFMPSKKAQPSTESQLAGKHPVGNLWWHESDYVQQERCKTSYLKRMICLERLPPRQVFRLGQKRYKPQLGLSC